MVCLIIEMRKASEWDSADVTSVISDGRLVAIDAFLSDVIHRVSKSLHVQSVATRRESPAMPIVASQTRH